MVTEGAKQIFLAIPSSLMEAELHANDIITP